VLDNKFNCFNFFFGLYEVKTGMKKLYHIYHDEKLIFLYKEKKEEHIFGKT